MMLKNTNTPFINTQFEDLEYIKFIYPSDAQKKSGKFMKYRVMVMGYFIDFETLRGQKRSGVDYYKNKWETKMLDHYGYFINTLGNDGDEVDVFVEGKASLDEVLERPIFTIKQVETLGRNQGEYDEDKVILGARNMTHARNIYLRNYALGWQGVGAIREIKSLNAFLTTSKCRTFN